jgi:hypothetical protein
MGTQRAWLPGSFLRLVESWRRALARRGKVSDAIVTPAQVAAFTEHRQATRRWGEPVQVFLEVGLPGSEALRGWIMNRSSGGLGLSVPQPVEERTIVRVRTVTAPSAVPWVEAEVINCQPQAGRWFLHCRYAAPPPSEAVLLFK